MKHATYSRGLSCMLLVWTGCNSSPGRPKSDSAVIPPDQVMDSICSTTRTVQDAMERAEKVERRSLWPIRFFSQLLTIPRFVAPSQMECPVPPMPAFARVRGGMLTEKQIEALVRGIRSWAKSDVLR